MSRQNNSWILPVLGFAAAGVAGLGIGALLAAASRNGSTGSTGRRPEFEQARAIVEPQLRRAAALMGIPKPKLVITMATGNASANGRIVQVNPVWLVRRLQDFCDSQTCSVSFVLGLAAHELGHHVDWPYIHRRGQHEAELVADHWAGWVLALAGVDPSDFARILCALSEIGSASHPACPRRMAAVQCGYGQGLVEAQGREHGTWPMV